MKHFSLFLNSEKIIDKFGTNFLSLTKKQNKLEGFLAESTIRG